MMKNDMECFIQKAMETLQDTAVPDGERKEAVLKRVLARGKTKKAAERFKSFILVYPWRFALGVAVAQNAICTLAFGSDYTNLIMQLMGR